MSSFGGIEQDTILMRVIAAGTSEAAAGIDEVAAATDRLSAAEVTQTKVATRQAEKNSWLMNQMMFSARRYAFYTTTALGMVAAGAIYAGFKFDAMMQSAQLAFSGLLHSSSLAKQELTMLFNTAAHSPFMFQNLTNATRTLLAFGMTLPQANAVLMSSANSLAYFGKSGESLENVAATFGKINQSGYLLMRQMRQLVVAGIPVFPALRKELHLTQAQITEFMAGKLKIPSDVGIHALLAYMNSRFSDGMQRFSKTWTGRWTTFKDYSQMLMGSIVKGPFNFLLSGLGKVNDALAKLFEVYQKQGPKAFINEVDKMAGAHGLLAFGINQVVTVFKNLWSFIRNNIIPTFKVAIGVFIFTFGIMLWAINTVLGPFAKHMNLLKWIIDLWIIRLIAQFTWTVLTAVAQGIWNTVMWSGWVIMRAMVLMGTIWEGVIIALGLAQWALTGSLESTEAALFLFKLQVIATVWWTRALTAAQWLLNFAMDANPVGIIILAFGLLILTIYELYKHYHNLRKAILDALAIAYMFAFPFIAVALLVINHWGTVKKWFWDFAHFMESIWNAIASIATRTWGFITQVASEAWGGLVKMIKGAVDWVINGLNWVIHKINWATGAYNQVFGWATGNVPKIPDIPLLSTGGDITHSGLAVIAEKGPEAVFLPVGAQVRPMASLDKHIADKRMGRPKLQAIIPLSIDGNQIAQYTADIILTTQAGMGA